MDVYKPIRCWFYFFIWSVLCDVTSSRCPTLNQCQCYTEDKSRQIKYVITCVNITQNLLHQFKQFRGKTISKLLMNNNTFSDITDDTFQGLTIHELDLSFSEFESIGGKTFSRIKSLSKLKLNNAGLNFKNLDFLTNLTRLKYLSMDNNDVYQVRFPSNQFREKNLRSLKGLSLSGCEIVKIPDNTFEGSTNLEKLNLSSNKLTEVPDAILKLVNLKVLDLSHNEKISHIHNKAFSSLKKLRKIYMKGTDNTRIESEAFTGLEETLEVLVLADGQLTGGYHLARALRPLRSLKKLDLSNNMIIHMQNDSFDHFHSLNELDISGNRLVFTDTTFQGLELSLTTLKIRHMELTTLPLDSLIILEKLYNLDASNNLFTSLNRGFFGKIKAKNIILTGMNIDSVESSAFKDLSGPIILILDHNSISNISFILQLDTCFFKKISLLDNPLICDCDSLAIVNSNISLDISGNCGDNRFNGSDLNKVKLETSVTEECDLMKYKTHACNPYQVNRSDHKQSSLHYLVFLIIIQVYLYEFDEDTS